MSDELMSVAEVSAALGVKPETVYAYVSRGLLTPRQKAGDRRSWFDPGEVHAVAGRGRGRGDSDRTEIRVESAVTRIDATGHSYRGRPASGLAGDVAFERVAELLWTGVLPDSATWKPDSDMVRRARRLTRTLPADVDPVDTLPLLVSMFRAVDPMRDDLRGEAVALTARRLVASLVEALASGGDGSSESIARGVWGALSERRPDTSELAVIDTALVLLADHELAASTFAVRMAAAYRADPYGAVLAGLGVLGGALHGAASRGVEALLGEAASGAERSVGARLRDGGRVPGVGHPLYADGDPRFEVLLDTVRAAAPRARMAEVDEILELLRRRGMPPPNVDFGLGAVAHCLDLPPGSGELLFAVARTAGWVAHAIEEYESPSQLRPRAVYVGPRT